MRRRIRDIRQVFDEHMTRALAAERERAGGGGQFFPKGVEGVDKGFKAGIRSASELHFPGGAAVIKGKGKNYPRKEIME